MKLTPTLRKAAILISSLDARSADALLEQMGEAQAQRVRDAIMELDDIDPAEQERIINEFLGGQQPAKADDDGVELSGSLAAAIQQGPATATKIAVKPLPPAENSPPFGFLQGIGSDVLARYLQREHPQTVAVVMAHLPPPRAAAVVRHLPTAMQTDVLLRVGEMDDMHLEVVREVERGLEVILAPELQAARKKGSGAATLEAILSAAGETGELPVAKPRVPPVALVPESAPRFVPPTPTRQAVAPRQVTSSPEMEPVLPAIDFAQLSQLDDPSWAKVLRAADPQVSLLALAGASPALVERLLRQLAPRDAQALQRRMESLGAVRLRDIEHAQQQLARIAAQLAARGELRLPRQRPFATAA